MLERARFDSLQQHKQTMCAVNVSRHRVNLSLFLPPTHPMATLIIKTNHGLPEVPFNRVAVGAPRAMSLYTFPHMNQELYFISTDKIRILSPSLLRIFLFTYTCLYSHLNFTQNSNK